MTSARHCTRDNIIMFGAEYSPTPIVVTTADRSLTNASDSPRTRSPVHTYLKAFQGTPTATRTQTATPGHTPSTAPDAQSRTCTIFLTKVLLVKRDLFVLHAIANCWSSLVDTASVVRHAVADDTAVTPGGYANQDYGTRTLTFSNPLSSHSPDSSIPA